MEPVLGILTEVVINHVQIADVDWAIHLNLAGLQVRGKGWHGLFDKHMIGEAFPPLLSCKAPLLMKPMAMDCPL